MAQDTTPEELDGCISCRMDIVLYNILPYLWPNQNLQSKFQLKKMDFCSLELSCNLLPAPEKCFLRSFLRSRIQCPQYLCELTWSAVGAALHLAWAEILVRGGVFLVKSEIRIWSEYFFFPFF